MEIEMKIRGLMMDPMTNLPVVILKEACGNGILPIWVGVHEANAIALEIERVVTPRPMTHDLLKNVLLGLQAHVQKVVVTGIKDETFYAMIWVDRDGGLVSIDSRPSDAFALALRIDCPIFVEEAVLKSFQSQCAGRRCLKQGRETVAGEPQRRGFRQIQDVRFIAFHSRSSAAHQRSSERKINVRLRNLQNRLGVFGSDFISDPEGRLRLNAAFH